LRNNTRAALAHVPVVRTVDGMRAIDAGMLTAAAALVAYALVGCGRRSAPAVLASPTFTPGVLNAAVTQASIGATICRHGWTATVRPPTSYTSALKVQQMAEYGEVGRPAAYQEDHLISLELGGDPTDRRNLWPEPYPRASQVDRIENELNAAVCAGRLSLDEAQRRESALKHDYG
jgi:hypothetical protein